MYLNLQPTNQQTILRTIAECKLELLQHAFAGEKFNLDTKKKIYLIYAQNNKMFVKTRSIFVIFDCTEFLDYPYLSGLLSTFIYTIHKKVYRIRTSNFLFSRIPTFLNVLNKSKLLFLYFRVPREYCFWVKLLKLRFWRIYMFWGFLNLKMTSLMVGLNVYLLSIYLKNR